MSTRPLDLSQLPPTCLLHTRLSPEQTRSIETQLRTAGCRLADSATATLFLADTNTRARAAFELRGRGVKIVDTGVAAVGDVVRVVKLAWLRESVAAGYVLPLEEYAVYTATRSPLPLSPRRSKKEQDERRGREILERARRDAERNGEKRARLKYLRHGGEGAGESVLQKKGIEEILALSGQGEPVARKSTPEAEEEVMEARSMRGVRDMPEWVQKNIQYSCRRPTPADSPNSLFIAQLRTIRLSRTLSSSTRGTHAYSTMVASLQAYPHLLRSSAEVTLLPGCSTKAAALFSEWQHSHRTPAKRSLRAVRDLADSASFQTLSLFHGILGVDPATARSWYFDKGWRGLDDIVQSGWGEITRSQQVGIKYYDDFQLRIPRDEAARIGATIGTAAAELTPGTEYTITGSYRRGKSTLRDIDILLSHPHPPTPFTLSPLLASLDRSHYILHTLSHTPATRSTLEHASVVWREPGGGGGAHRHIDIVLSPAASVGAALLAWTGGKTFVRDLQSWCVKERGWEFSGVGVIGPGERVEVDARWREGEEMEAAERRLLGGLGVGWVRPEERCTG